MYRRLIILDSVGASLMDIEWHSVSQILSAQYKLKSLAIYKNEFFSVCLYFCKSSRIEIFVGKEGEEGSQVCTVSYCYF